MKIYDNGCETYPVHRERRIKIDCHIDRFGGLVMEPSSLAAWSAFTAHMQDAAGFQGDEAGRVYLQEVDDATLAEYFSPQQVRLLNRGYWLVILMTPFDYGMLLGYDAHLVDVTAPRWSAKYRERCQTLHPVRTGETT